MCWWVAVFLFFRKPPLPCFLSKNSTLGTNSTIVEVESKTLIPAGYFQLVSQKGLTVLRTERLPACKFNEEVWPVTQAFSLQNKSSIIKVPHHFQWISAAGGTGWWWYPSDLHSDKPWPLTFSFTKWNLQTVRIDIPLFSSPSSKSCG